MASAGDTTLVASESTISAGGAPMATKQACPAIARSVVAPLRAVAFAHASATTAAGIGHPTTAFTTDSTTTASAISRIAIAARIAIYMAIWRWGRATTTTAGVCGA